MNERHYQGPASVLLPEIQILLPDNDREIRWPGAYFGYDGCKFGDRDTTVFMSFHEMMVAYEMPAYRERVLPMHRIPEEDFLVAVADTTVTNAKLLSGELEELGNLWPHFYLPSVSHISQGEIYKNIEASMIAEMPAMLLKYKEILWADVISGSEIKTELAAYFDNFDVEDCEPKMRRVLTLDEMTRIRPAIMEIETMGEVPEIASVELDLGISNLNKNKARLGAKTLIESNFRHWPVPHNKFNF